MEEFMLFQSIRKISSYLVLLSILGGVLTACGGGDSPAPSGDGPYLVYQSGSRITVVDKTDPENTRLVAEDALSGGDRNHTGENVFMISQLGIDLDTRISTFHDPELLVYAGETKFWKLDLAEGSDLTPQALMSETYSQLCKLEFEKDGLTLANNYLFYELPGPDNDCELDSDNTRWVMQVSKSQLHPALEITSKVSHLNNVLHSLVIPVYDVEANYQVLGFVAVHENHIRYYSPDFNTFETVATAVDISTLRLDLEPIGKDGFFIELDRKVYWYNLQTKELSTALHSMADNTYSSDFHCDKSECFFVNTQTTGDLDSIIYRVAADGSGDSVEFTTVAGGLGSTWNFEVTSEYLYVDKDESSELIAIKRSDGSDALIDSNVQSVFSMNQFLYINRDDAAVIRNWDGSLVSETPKASWLGAMFSGYNDTTSQVKGIILLARKADGQLDFSSATVESYNTETNSKLADIGTLPTGVEYFFGFGYGSGGLLAQIGSYITANVDLVWLDSVQDDSLVRLTDDTDVEEIINP